jgi:hypothetical protein
MPPLRIPESFTKSLDKKPPELAGAIVKCVDQLGDNPRHPSLQTHPVRGTRNPKIFEAYVDMKNRVTFHWDQGRIVMRVHCNHDILKRP